MPTPTPRPLFPSPAAFAWLTVALLIAVMLPGTGFGDVAPTPQAPATPGALAFFETKIRPVLADNCYGCHGKDAQIAGLRVDSREALVKGGDGGTSLVPGDPEKSLLVQVVRHAGKIKMPQGGKLKDNEIADLAAWVAMGAPWTPKTAVRVVAAPAPAGAATPTGTATPTLWSLKPVTTPAPPPVKNAAWCASPLDRFVLARLEARGLTPAAPADRRTLLRRVTYDLTGLPPTLADTAAFLADKRPDAYEKAVNRLLASPRYGERMARLWLDVARYADTRGYVFAENREYPNAYTYRDWVINAFNRDLPYSDFVVAQLAADRLPEKNGDNSDLAALGFLTVGRRFLNVEPDIIDDRIDVTMRGLQGFTVACARCHDHKFDPVPTQDYYSLYAIFKASQETAPRISASPVHVAMAMADVPSPAEGRVFKRGNPGNLGDVAPRRFLLALSPNTAPRPVYENGSGRLELARAIASPTNPLTARVFVNRVWRMHFGQGLVRTASDFGHQGEPPTHPELLDHLATRFVADGWSVKALHRRIVLSQTYRQSSAFAPKSQAADPENRLLWRFTRRRLDLEQIRDSLLFASGNLDTKTVGGQSEDLWNAPFTPRRAVYGRIDRQNLPQTFRTWDYASPDATNAGRFVTTVPQQSLFFLNAPLVVEQARALAALPEVAKATGNAARTRVLYRRLFGRSPAPDELALGVRYLSGADAGGVLPVSPWHYGYAAWDDAAGRLSDVVPLAHFAGAAYQGGAIIPDRQLSHAMLTSDGGHPGKDATQAVVRRFIASRDLTVTVTGTLAHSQKRGDGVAAALVSARGGMLGKWAAHDSRAETTVRNIALKRGETLDFVVSPGAGGAAFDSFSWSPEIAETGGKRELWGAKSGFASPAPAPLGRPARYAQALLTTNEFLFVD